MLRYANGVRVGVNLVYFYPPLEDSYFDQMPDAEMENLAKSMAIFLDGSKGLAVHTYFFDLVSRRPQIGETEARNAEGLPVSLSQGQLIENPAFTGEIIKTNYLDR